MRRLSLIVAATLITAAECLPLPEPGRRNWLGGPEWAGTAAADWTVAAEGRAAAAADQTRGGATSSGST